MAAICSEYSVLILALQLLISHLQNDVEPSLNCNLRDARMRLLDSCESVRTSNAGSRSWLSGGRSRGSSFDVPIGTEHLASAALCRRLFARPGRLLRDV